MLKAQPSFNNQTAPRRFHYEEAFSFRAGMLAAMSMKGTTWK